MNIRRIKEIKKGDPRKAYELACAGSNQIVIKPDIIRVYDIFGNWISFDPSIVR